MLFFQLVEKELAECQALVDDADRLAAKVSTAQGVSEMVAEYRALYADVRLRLDLARAEVVGDVDTAVQVSTNYKCREKFNCAIYFQSYHLH